MREEFYGEHKGKPFFEELINFICSDLVVGLELVCSDAITKWRNLIGPTNCQVARIEQPNSIRALFGREGVKNAVHGSDSRKRMRPPPGLPRILQIGPFVSQAGLISCPLLAAATDV